MKHPFLQCGVVVFLLGIAGCSHQPKWTHGTSRSDLYYQGVGSGPTENEADRRALLELTAEIEGREVESVTEDYQRDSVHVADGHVDSDEIHILQQWILERVKGTVPAGAHIVERDHSGRLHKSYALAERPGQGRRIQKQYYERIQGLRLHALVPGWSQFQTRRSRRAWTYISSIGVGVVGGVAFATASDDARDRRDLATIRTERSHYDDLANQRFWLSAGFYTLALGAYAANVFDGLTIQPKRHELLVGTSPTRLQVSWRF